MKLKLLLLAFALLAGSAEHVSAQKFLDKVLKGMEKTNKVLDEADKMLGGDNNNPNRSSNQSSRSKRVTGFKIVSPHPDLDIQFKRCAASASTVVIDLVMTWYGDDAKIYLGGSYNDKNTTTAYDDNGKQYSYDNIPLSVGGGNWSIYNEARLFPTDVPIKVRLEIHNVPESVQILKRLHICMRDVNDPITFYNIPIERADEMTSINNNQATPDEVLPDNSPLIAEQENTQETPKLKRIIGKWELVSLKQNGKEMPFKPCTFQFYDNPENDPNDDPYTKDMTETISGKTHQSGYGVMQDNDNELIMSLYITEDECDNGYIIQTVDSKELILSFGYYGDPKIKGELVFQKK